MFKKIAKIIFGNGTAQGLQLLLLPILITMYSPIQFGQLAQVIALSSLLCIIQSLQFNVAIVAANNDGVSSILGGFIFVTIISLSFSLFLVFSSYFFVDEEYWFFLISVISCSNLMAMNNYFRGSEIAQEKYNFVASCAFFRVVFLLLTQFLLASTKGVNGLVLGLIIGELILFLIFLFANNNANNMYSILNVKLKDINPQGIFGNKQYTLYGSLQEMTSTLIYWLPFITFLYMYDEYFGGQYSVVSRLYWPLAVLISGAIAQVLLRELSRAKQCDVLKTSIYRHEVKIMFLFIFVIGYFISPKVFAILVNDNWQLAIDYSKYVSILCITFLYIVPYRTLYRVMKAQSSLLLFELIYISFFAILFLLLYYYFTLPPETSLIFMVVLYMIKSAFIELYIRRLISKKVNCES